MTWKVIDVTMLLVLWVGSTILVVWSFGDYDLGPLRVIWLGATGIVLQFLVLVPGKASPLGFERIETRSAMITLIVNARIGTSSIGRQAIPSVYRKRTNGINGFGRVP